MKDLVKFVQSDQVYLANKLNLFTMAALKGRCD